DVEDFLRSLEKESCLCGTVHVKMAAAVITVIDLLIIFFLDQHVYQTRFDSYKYAMPIVLASYGCILLAQCGLRYKKCWMMVPMLVIHISVLLLCILGAARDILTIITSASDIAINRRVMVGFYEGCAVLINLYVVFILFRAFFNLRSSKTLLPLTIVNSIFNGQHPGLFDGQEEVLFEKPKMGTPSTPKNRTVRFVEPKNETFSLS
uniref:Uncharacterized protein n=1 Tax=Panagrolaimus sp. JU765 TaxID=591449 RepID=A0AC34PZN6_9BILA